MFFFASLFGTLFSYFYWLVLNSHLSRVPMSDMLVVNSNTDISSLPSREKLVDNTTFPFPSAFAIDLQNLNLVYVSNHSVFLRSLNEDQTKEFFLGNDNFPLEYVSLYQNFAISYVTEFLVVTKMVLPFANPWDHQELLHFDHLGYVPNAKSLFQECLQPLLGQLAGMPGMHNTSERQFQYILFQ